MIARSATTTATTRVPPRTPRLLRSDGKKSVLVSEINRGVILYAVAVWLTNAAKSPADAWLDAQAQLVGPRWRSPLRNTSPWGEQVFEWWHGERKLTVYFQNTADVEYMKVWGPDVDTEMESGNIGATAFQDLWRWLHST